MPAGWVELLDVDGSPVRGEAGEFRSARAMFADLGAAAGPVVGSFAALRDAGLGGSAGSVEAAGEWVEPFADLVDHVDSALGDVPRVCDDLVSTFDAHLDGLETLWLEADEALRWARDAHSQVVAARWRLSAAEQGEARARASADLVPVDDASVVVAEWEAQEASAATDSARAELTSAESALEQVRDKWQSLRDAERRLDDETADRIDDQQLWDLKDPGRLRSVVTGGWNWVSDLDNLHLVLDIAGIVPGLGDIADVLNASIYVMEGDYQNAALSGLSLIPGVSGGVVTRLAGKADEAVDGVRTIARAESAASGARLNAQLVGEEIAGGHAYSKHVLELAEFPGLRTRGEFASMVENVVADYDDFKPLANGRSAYWRDGVVVVRDPSALDGGTAFVPVKGYDYFLRL